MAQAEEFTEDDCFFSHCQPPFNFQARLGLVRKKQTEKNNKSF